MKKNLITLAMLFAASNIVLAAEPSSSLPAIQVYSAYAAPVGEAQTASSVTVLTEKTFAERNATYVLDVLRTVPSVNFTASGGRGTLSNLYLRGANANHTAVIVDGVKVNPVSGDGVDFGGLSLSNIERIEVLRGEQSALWGSDAMGGVIYITTKSGLYKEKPLNLDYDLGTGSHGTYNTSATISGYQNGFYYALHGDRYQTKGISALSSNYFHYRAADGTSVNKGGAVEKDAFYRGNGSLRLGFDDNNKGLEFLASHSSQTAHFDENYLRSETEFDDRTRTRETLLKVSGYVGNQQDLFKHKLSFSQVKTESDTFSTTNLYDPVTYAKIATVPSLRGADAKKRNASYQLDVNFDRDGAVTQAVSLLAEYQKSAYQSNNYRSEKQLNEKSIAAEYRWFSEQDHSFSVSGRYTDNSQYRNAFTGRIATSYRVSPNVKTHASFGSAIQNPTMVEYYGYYGNYVGNPNLKPARSLGGEVGALFESADKAHHLDVSYFARNVKDFISGNATYTSSINLEGTTKIKGVELAYDSKLSEKLTAYANYTFTATKDSKGISLARRAKHMANAGVAYQFSEQFGSQLSLSYVGKRVDVDFPRRATLPSYTLVNLGANYQLNQAVNFYVNLNNLFNKKYEHTLGYGQDGRNVYAGIKGSF